MERSLAPAPSRRLPTLDIVRGALMVLIIATHALHGIDPDAAPRSARLGLRYLLSGTVGFTTVSGMLIGYFLVVKAADMARIESRYRTQSLRLLILAHPLIVLALAGPMAGDISAWEYGVRTLFITDTLALLFLFVVPVAGRASATARLWIGIALIVVARLLWLVPVEQRGLLLARDFLCGVGEGEHVLISTYAVLPLCGFFLIGSFVGHHFALAERRGGLAPLARRLALAACGAIALSGLMVAMWAAGKRGVPLLSADPVRHMLYPDYHLSLYPFYLGTCLLMMAYLVRRHTVGPVLRFFLIFGKTSLFTYVVQYYVVQTLPWALGWDGAMSAPHLAGFLAVSLGLLFVLATAWNRFVKKA
jgi:hypothetical protein